ncbi:hypothetical protein BB560_005307, partial [Smittium megazygosporum]
MKGYCYPFELLLLSRTNRVALVLPVTAELCRQSLSYTELTSQPNGRAAIGHSEPFEMLPNLRFSETGCETLANNFYVLKFSIVFSGDSDNKLT